MTTRNDTADFAFDYTRGNNKAAPNGTGLAFRFIKWIDSIAERRAEVALARLTYMDPTLAERIRVAREEPTADVSKN